jgi:branched-chain amino acid transport system permease protein
MATQPHATPAAAGPDYAAAAREALIAGAIAFGLFVLFVGLETAQNIHNELILVQHWVSLAVLIVLIMAVRFAMLAFVYPAMDRRKATAQSARKTTGTSNNGFARHWVKFAITGLFLYPILVVLIGAFFAGSLAGGFQVSLKWVDNYGIQVLIYVMLAWGLNIVVGLAGLLDLGYVAFYAVGAYIYALMSVHFGLSFWVLLPIAGIFAALWGITLGFPVLRLRGDYLAIVTLAFGEIIRLVLVNWTSVTKGTFGISGIPKATLFGIPFTPVRTGQPDATLFGIPFPQANVGFAALFDLPISPAYYKIFLFYVILTLTLITGFVTLRLRNLPIGRAWEALREDEVACRSLGINTTNTKLTAFAIGAMFGGFAGAFFAARQGFISPESFIFLESAIILAIVVLGGMGSLVGIAIAAAVMTIAPELLREMTFLKAVMGEDFTPELYRMLIFGLAMVAVMLYKPRGFVGSRTPTAFMFERKQVSGSFTKEGHG